VDDNSRFVLLVDDEAPIRKLVRCALENSNCEVLEAASGPEAVDLFPYYEPQIALLLTDIMMPGMQGDELAELLTELHPGLPVLFISAYCPQIRPSVRHFACLAKPFDLAALTCKVNEILRHPR
jgi:two-component system, cell cycle sensor histidine kinase and response regulator CckA